MTKLIPQLTRNVGRRPHCLLWTKYRQVSFYKIHHRNSSIQPSSEEARELHELMLEVIEKDVTEINGQKLVPMKDTEVGFHDTAKIRAYTADRIGTIDVSPGS